jgi:hypothetical protein
VKNNKRNEVEAEHIQEMPIIVQFSVVSYDEVNTHVTTQNEVLVKMFGSERKVSGEG